MKFQIFHILCLCVALITPFEGHAASTEVFVEQGADAFHEGEFDGTVLDAFGVVRPGLGAEGFSYDGVEGFSVVTQAKKGSVFVGAATDGLILRFSKGRFSELYRSDLEKNDKDIRVTAMAATDKGVWAAFAPSGALLFIDNDGKASRVSGLDAGYIWKILPSPEGGVVVGTGLPAGVHHVSDEGKVRPGVHEIDALHIMDFEVVASELWVATAMPASVQRLQEKGKTSVLFELGAADEVVSIVNAKEGGVYLLTNQGAPTAKSAAKKSEKKSRKMKGALGHAKAAVDAFGPSKPAPKSVKLPKGSAVWHVDENAAPRLIRSLGSEPGLSLSTIEGSDLGNRVGGIVVGMSEEGRAYTLSPEGHAAVLQDVRESSIEAMVFAADGAGHFVTAGGAALYRVNPQVRKARYLSPVRDASLSVKVGRVDFVGTGVRLEVRTGATAAPMQNSWSQWGPVSAAGGAPRIKAGRFIQYRAVFSTSESELRAVRIAYRAPNRTPRIQSLEFVDRKSKVSSSESTGKAKGEKGLRKAKKVLNSVKAKRYTGIKRIGFNVQDPDGDDLRFVVRSRQIDTEHWVTLTPDSGVSVAYVDWVVADYPDGHYEVEAVVRDSESNPPGEGLSSRTVSQPVLVDNHPPEILSARTRVGNLEFRVRDAVSPIRKVEIAVDGGPWRALASVDGMVDGRDESFAVKLKELTVQAPALIRIAAEDSFGHRSVQGVNVR